MNSTTSNFDIYSTFTYDDINKYFESLNKCNSDSDCPENSNCIGNKCNTLFYCKEGDKSKCALFKNICNGKSCFVPRDRCDKDEDCLSGQCEYNECKNSIYSDDTYSYLDTINGYSISHFTYENAKTYFEKLNKPCKGSKDCPNLTYCGNDLAPNYVIYEDEGLSGHCVGHFYCKKNKSDCSFNYDEDNGIRYTSNIASSINEFGIEYNKKCRYDGECFDGKCRGKNFFGNGRCDQPSDSDGLSSMGFVLFFFIMLFIIASLGFCTLVVLIIKVKENHKRKKNGLEKRKYKSLKPLLICDAIAISIVIIFLIIIYIDNYLNKQPLS